MKYSFRQSNSSQAPEAITEDFTVTNETFGGDSGNFVGMKDKLDGEEGSWLECAIVGKPKKEAVWTPSSKEKFELQAMRYNPKKFGGFEKVEIVD